MRFYPANLDIVFEEILDKKDEFTLEFDKLSGSEDDPLGQTVLVSPRSLRPLSAWSSQIPAR